MSKYDEQMQAIKDRYRNRTQDIRSHPDWSQEAKVRYLREEYQKATREYEDIYQKKREDVEQRLHATRKQAFSPPIIPASDKALIAMSYRDALDRVAKLQNPEELRAILSRSDLVGDEVQSKACLTRAYELEHSGLVGEYLADRPSERQRWDAFTSAAEECNALEGEHQLFGSLAPELPEELESEYGEPNSLRRRVAQSTVDADQKAANDALHRALQAAMSPAGGVEASEGE